MPDGCLPDHLYLNPYPTVKTLKPIRQKNLLSHAVTLTIEEVVRSEGVAKCRWLSILHLLPRLLLLNSIHTRHQTTPPASDMITTNTPPPNPPRPSSSRNPLGGRRVGAPRDIPGDAFEARVRAFPQGRFWELLCPSLDITLAPIRAHEHPETPHDNTDPPLPLDPSAVGLSKFATLSE